MADKKKKFNKTIALVGGSFKPPTKGHWYMVEEYAKIADEVRVIISTPSPKSIRKTKTGIVITPEMSKKIFEIFAKRYGLSDKVKPEISKEASSIRSVYVCAEEELSNCNVIFGCSKKGDDLDRFKTAVNYFKDKGHNINLLDPVKTAVEPFKSEDGVEVSATTIRDNIDNKKIVTSMLPDKLTSADIDKILKMLSGKQKVNEGGNAVAGASRINKANVEATVDDFFSKVLPILKLDRKEVEVAGSAGKKETSGDIDVAVGGIKNTKEFLNHAYSTLKQNDIESVLNIGLGEVFVKWPIANTDGKQEGSFVQIDLMPGENLEMIKWGMYNADPSKQKYKTAVRNIFMCDVAGFVDRKIIEYAEVNGKKVPAVEERYILSTIDGLYRKTRSFKGKKPGTIVKSATTIKNQFITSDVDKIVKILFTPQTKPEDCLTIEDTWEQFKKSKLFKDKEIVNAILTKTSTALKNMGLEYPSFLNPTKKIDEAAPDYGDDFLKNYVDFDKSTISYLGNMKMNSFFGPKDHLCEINLVGKVANDEIQVVFENGEWEIEIDGNRVSHTKKAYKSFVNGKEFKKLEDKLFKKWSEYARYPRRALKAAKISFASTGTQKFTDEELKHMCAQKIKSLREEFPRKYWNA